jgi:hypothetical protein
VEGWGLDRLLHGTQRATHAGMPSGRLCADLICLQFSNHRRKRPGSAPLGLLLRPHRGGARHAVEGNTAGAPLRAVPGDGLRPADALAAGVCGWGVGGGTLSPACRGRLDSISEGASARAQKTRHSRAIRQQIGLGAQDGGGLPACLSAVLEQLQGGVEFWRVGACAGSRGAGQ